MSARGGVALRRGGQDRRYRPEMATTGPGEAPPEEKLVADGGVPGPPESAGASARETQEERRHARRTAIIVALISGVIGGGVGGFGTAVYTASQDDDRARDEFLSTQRSAVYGDFLTDAQRLQTLLVTTRSSYPPQDQVPGMQPSLPAELSEELTAAVSKFYADYYRVQVLSTSEVFEAADAVRIDLDLGFRPYQVVADCATDAGRWLDCPNRPPVLPGEDDPPEAESLEQQQREFGSFVDDESDFADKAGRELGNNR